MLNKTAAVVGLCLSLLVAPALAVARSAPDAVPEPVRVMIVGSYHFDNPGQDLNNARIAPVTTPEKQAQLAAISERLARFQPTAVAVERIAADPDTLLDQVYPRFDPAMLASNPDERVQIGYRLASRLGLTRVYAIDEQSDDKDYFPFQPILDWWEAHDQSDAFARLNAPIAEATAGLERRQHTDSIGDILADMNDPNDALNGPAGQSTFYYGVLKVGDGRSQPGAALNAGWYERNARIFAKLAAVARPGDRIVVVYGAGHNYWLRHFVTMTPGFVLEEASPYLADD